MTHSGIPIDSNPRRRLQCRRDRHGATGVPGTISVPLNDLDATTIELHGKGYRLDSYEAAFVRLRDISHAAPTEPLAEKSAAIYRTFCRVFTHARIPVINPPLRDPSNFSKLLHAAEFAAIAGWQIPRSCLTNNPAIVRAFLRSCAVGVYLQRRKRREDLGDPLQSTQARKEARASLLVPGAVPRVHRWARRPSSRRRKQPLCGGNHVDHT